MRFIRIAAGALNQTPLDWDGNLGNIIAAIVEARRRKVSLLCLPELCVTGYGCEDAFYSAAVSKMAQRVVGELLPETKELAVTVGLPLPHAGAIYNASAMLVNGRVAGLVAKQHLAGDGLHYEPRWFKRWPAGARTQVHFAGCECPLGDVLFDFDGIRVGFEICEDAWVADRLAKEQARRGVDIILNPSASHFAFGKSAVRRQLVTEASRVFGATYCYSNLLGNEAGRVIYDGETLIASLGELVACGPRLEFANVVLAAAAVDVDATRMRRAQSASYEPALKIDEGEIVDAGFSLEPIGEPSGTVAILRCPGSGHHAAWSGLSPSPGRFSDGLLTACGPEQRVAPQPSWESSVQHKEQEFTRAIALGLFDYLRKSHSSGFVVSLSGGADSAAVASLVAMMVRLGTAQLGIEAFCRSLGIQADPQSPVNATSLTERLLTTVYQATRNSTETTRLAARAVAAAIHAMHIELDVDDICNRYTDQIERSLNRRLTWELDDNALQNIQARVRGPSVWLIANATNALLLATSNRSEAAVGYATMDGDTCGAISPLAGIDKAFLRQWLGWLEKEGPVGIGPIPELAVVNHQQPTAELRPPAAAQTDEDDLMPYDILDAIERHAIGERRSPSEVLAVIRAQFQTVGDCPDFSESAEKGTDRRLVGTVPFSGTVLKQLPKYSREQLAQWVRRFFELWCRNQWKRERYAPSFHVDDKNLDPKTWCRFPILSGGFRRELAEMAAAVDEKNSCLAHFPLLT